MATLLSYFNNPRKESLRIQIRVNEIQNILSICAEYTAGTGTIAVQTEGCNTRNNTAITQEIGATRVSEACAACVMIVGQQHGEVAYDTTVDLVQFGVSYITRSGVARQEGGLGREAFLQTIANRSKANVLQAAFCLEYVELVYRRKRAILTRDRDWDARGLEDNHTNVMDKEWSGGVKWMRGPRNCFHTVQASKRVIIGDASSTSFNVRIPEDSHATEFTRGSGAMSGSQKDRCGKQGATTSKCGGTVYFHQ